MRVADYQPRGRSEGDLMFDAAALRRAFPLLIQVHPLVEFDASPRGRRDFAAPPATSRCRSSASLYPRASPPRSRHRTPLALGMTPAWRRSPHRPAAHPRCPIAAPLGWRSRSKSAPAIAIARDCLSQPPPPPTASDSPPLVEHHFLARHQVPPPASIPNPNVVCADPIPPPSSAPTPGSALPPSQRQPISNIGVGCVVSDTAPAAR